MTSQFDASLFIQNLPQGVANFVEPLLAQLHQLGLDGEYSQIDHVCYRVLDLATYELLKEGCAAVGTLLSEAYINARPIACYRLHQPVALSSGRFVDVFELPAPKPGVSYVQGFEHIEVVTTGGLESFRAKFSHLSLDVQNFGAGVNRDVSLKLSGGLVKFHEQPLAAIISEEKKAAGRKRRRVAIFDFDDTVMASKEPFLQAFHKAYEAALGVTIEDVVFREKQRPTLPEFFTALGVLDPAVRQRVQDLFGREWDLVARTCEQPVGVPSLLSCLASEGVDLHVWTARDAETTDSTLKTFGLRHYFKSIHGFEQNKPSKPNGSPELRELVKGAAAAVVVGDSVADQNAAKDLGVTFLQAAWITKNNLDVPEENICLTPLAALSKIMALSAQPLL